MKEKRPLLKKTVGAQYVAFNEPDTNGNYDIDSFEEVIKQETVKTIGVTENEEATAVTGSGKLYRTVSMRNSTEVATDVIAFDPQTLSRMRAETNTGGLVKSGAPAERPFFAYGYVEQKFDEGFRYVWYPKCQLISNTKDVADGGTSYSEQTDTVTIRAYAFDEAGNDNVYIDSEFETIPTGVTEALFFAKPVSKLEDLTEGA